MRNLTTVTRLSDGIDRRRHIYTRCNEISKLQAPCEDKTSWHGTTTTTRLHRHAFISSHGAFPFGFSFVVSVVFKTSPHS